MAPPLAEQLQNEPWFHGPLSRRQAERLLTKDGDFLVRESGTTPGQYVLTGQQGGQPKHLLLVDPEGVVSKSNTFNCILIKRISWSLMGFFCRYAPKITASRALVTWSAITWTTGYQSSLQEVKCVCSSQLSAEFERDVTFLHRARKSLCFPLFCRTVLELFSTGSIS